VIGFLTNGSGLEIINAEHGGIENSYFFYKHGISMYPDLLTPHYSTMIEPMLPNVYIITFFDNPNQRLLIGRIEFELAGKARIKNFICK